MVLICDPCQHLRDSGFCLNALDFSHVDAGPDTVGAERMCFTVFNLCMKANCGCKIFLNNGHICFSGCLATLQRSGLPQNARQTTSFLCLLVFLCKDQT